MPRRGEELTSAVSQAFSLPGAWVDLDPSQADYRADTGEVTLASNALGLTFNEVEVAYTAGFADIPEPTLGASADTDDVLTIAPPPRLAIICNSNTSPTRCSTPPSAPCSRPMSLYGSK